MSEEGIQTADFKRKTETVKFVFSPIDLMKTLSENTALAYPTVLELYRESRIKKI